MGPTDPFLLRGQHGTGPLAVQRAVLPDAVSAAILTRDESYPLERIDAHGLFARQGAPLPTPYRLRWQNQRGLHERYDPYLFGPVLDAATLSRFNAGLFTEAHHHLGGHRRIHDGVPGLFFAVWAPRAVRASVIGEFNGWNREFHPMRPRGSSGIWELFIPGIDGLLDYQFALETRVGDILIRADPYGQAYEPRPGTKAWIPEASHVWQDADWLERRQTNDWPHQPLHIYEVHLGSWKRGPGGTWLNYRELACDLIAYCRTMGYTHIELLPVLEHPLDESWGYQITGYFAPTGRFGTPDDFRALVDACHGAGLGVILDWVPAHFPRNEGALCRFDGEALYEYADPREGVHPDWGTLIFNYGRPEVRSFLLSSAACWLVDFHLDGLRVDAVSSMLYRDFSRAPGQWIPNHYGTPENLEAVSLLQALNEWAATHEPGVLMIAEESSAWPGVSRPVRKGGLGFSMKWNLGWFHDTVDYLRLPPPARNRQPGLLTFNRMYAFTERFLLPLSHDEVVHGKGPLIDKMPGDPREALANLRLLFVYQMLTPGKKLCFMGNEFGVSREWDVLAGLDWRESGQMPGSGILSLNRDLGRLYAAHPPLYDLDFDERGFEWTDCPAPGSAILAFLRLDRNGSRLAGIFNFSCQAVCDYPVPLGEGVVRLLLNSDWTGYGGRTPPGAGSLRAPRPDGPFEVDLPPLTALVLGPADPAKPRNL
jgi:1,4-alpha-glucan branching enzyme